MNKAPITPVPRHGSILLGMLVSALWICPVAADIPILGVTDSYAECVLAQVDKKKGPVEIQSIESECRTRFPGPSPRSALDARSVDACYRKHEDQVTHRQAAKAVFGACQDYFRAGSMEAATAMRGARLQ